MARITTHPQYPKRIEDVGELEIGKVYASKSQAPDIYHLYTKIYSNPTFVNLQTGKLELVTNHRLLEKYVFLCPDHVTLSNDD